MFEMTELPPTTTTTTPVVVERKGGFGQKKLVFPKVYPPLNGHVTCNAKDSTVENNMNAMVGKEGFFLPKTENDGSHQFSKVFKYKYYVR